MHSAAFLRSIDARTLYLKVYTLKQKRTTASVVVTEAVASL